MLGSLFCGVPAASGVRRRVLVMVRELCVIVSLLLCTAARALSTSIETSRHQDAWRLPRTISCDPRRRPAGPRSSLRAPPPRRDGSTRPDHPPGPELRCKACTIAPSARPGAHSGSSRPSASASLRRRRIGLPAGAARASHAATTLPRPGGAALHVSQRPRPEGRQHLPDALPAEGRRLRVPRGRHGGPV